MSTRSESRFVAVVRFAFRSSKRIAITAIGAALVLGGIAMLILPGPGIIVVIAGFAVLGTEYAWAAAALDRTKATAERAGQMAKDAAGSSARVAKGAALSTGRAARGAAGAAGGAAGRLRRRESSNGIDDV